MKLGSGLAWVTLGAVIAIAASSGACEADVEDDCTAGPCGGATVAAGSTVTIGAGGGGSGECVFPDTGEIPCDVYAILDARCHKCHTEPQAGGAPFPLLTWDDFQFLYPPGAESEKPVWQRADIAIEPDVFLRMPYMEDPLPEEQRAVLHAWFATCAAGECEKAPVGQGGAGGAGGAGGGTGGAGGAGTGGGGSGGAGGG